MPARMEKERSQKDPPHRPMVPILVTDPLSPRQLIFRRGLLFGMCIAILIAGIVIRIKVPVP